MLQNISNHRKLPCVYLTVLRHFSCRKRQVAFWPIRLFCFSNEHKNREKKLEYSVLLPPLTFRVEKTVKVSIFVLFARLPVKYLINAIRVHFTCVAENGKQTSRVPQQKSWLSNRASGISITFDFCSRRHTFATIRNVALLSRWLFSSLFFCFAAAAAALWSWIVSFFEFPGRNHSADVFILFL